MNEFITAAALIVGASQFIFIYNIVTSLRIGKPAGKNPWKANSLEWLTSEVPPVHGNFGEKLPVMFIDGLMTLMFQEQKKII